jgi:ketosteroid isomerase-like protein
MPQENVEQLARRVLELLSRGDAAPVNELADPDVEWHSFFAALGDEGVYHGYEGTRRFMNDINDAWDTVRGDVDEAHSVGDTAVLVGRIHYRGRVSGVETEAPAAWLTKFRDGRVISWRAFREPREALEAAGLG